MKCNDERVNGNQERRGPAAGPVRQMYADGDSGFVADDLGGMPPPGQVIGQENVARIEGPLAAVAEADLSLSFQKDDILATQRGVPVRWPPGGHAAELGPGGGAHRGQLEIGHLLVGQFQLLEVGLPILSGVDPDHLHRNSPRWIRASAVGYPPSDAGREKSPGVADWAGAIVTTGPRGVNLGAKLASLCTIEIRDSNHILPTRC